MISIYIQPDKTQIAKVKVKKNKLQVTLTKELPSYWDIFTSKDIEKAMELFSGLKRSVSMSYEEVYIVIPELLFTVIDCYDYNIQEDIAAKLKEITGRAMDTFYVSMPIDTRPSNPPKKTVFAIEKQYIDILIRASEEANITLNSVEAASMSFFRSLAKWTLDQPIVEIFDEQASIISYSPVGGIFKLDVPELSKNSLLSKDTQSANLAVRQAYAQNNLTASKTFKAMRTDADYIVLTGYEPILQIEQIRLNMPKESPVFSELIESGLSPKEQYEWMTVMGTMLQSLDHKNVYAEIPAFLEIESGNLLPDKALQRAKIRQWQQFATRVCRGAICFLVTLIVIEIMGMMFFDAAEISPQVRSDYNQALREKEEIEKELETLKLADDMDQKPLEAFTALLQAKPEGCGFTSVHIGTTDTKPDKAKKNKNWIQVSVVSKDQMIFQDFQSALLGTKEFESVIINSISSDNSKTQTATISISRKEKKK